MFNPSQSSARFHSLKTVVSLRNLTVLSCLSLSLYRFQGSLAAVALALTTWIIIPDRPLFVNTFFYLFYFLYIHLFFALQEWSFFKKIRAFQKFSQNNVLSIFQEKRIRYLTDSGVYGTIDRVGMRL